MPPSDDPKVFKAQLQEFAPQDLPRILETSTPETLEYILSMAVDTLMVLRKLPPGQARDEQIRGSCQTIVAALDERERREP